MVINAERNVAKGLGNLERLEKWQQTQFFAVAREEWFRACTSSLRGMGSQRS